MITVQNYIYGEFEDTQTHLDSFNPATGEVWSQIPDSNADIVDRAVVAAKSASRNWAKLSNEKRAQYLIKAADLLESRLEEFAFLESQDQGKPVSLAKKVDIPRAIYNLRSFAQCWPYLREASTVQPEFHAINYTTRSPVGVAALISPWNLPLYLLTFKIAPALMAGNTVVCKPSEFTSVTAWKLCQIFDEVGLPRGVVNLVCGLGHKAGEALIKHPTVNAISFTGSSKTGTRIAEIAAPLLKKLSLELGGKNPGIIFEDADIDKAVNTFIRACFLNQGEVCLCTERLFVQESVFEEFKDKFVAKTKRLKVGDPSDPDVFMGPLVSSEHLDKVRYYVDLAVKEGANIECGEPANHMGFLDEKFSNGYFLQPTIITELLDSSSVMQEEIFGPVVCITPFSTLEEVIQRANDVEYGLCAVVFTKNINLAHKTAASLEVGTVWINSWLVRDLTMPFGGMKKSGMGREGLLHSIETFTEEKTTCIQLSH